MAKVTMPQLGESVAEGTIGRWLKRPGERVEKDEPLVEVITDKVNAEVPSPCAGVLTAILVDEGATVPNGAEIAEIETAEVSAVAEPATSGLPSIGDPDARMTPAVRRLLREHGLAAERVRGTGGGGRITKEDVLAAVEASRPAAASAPGAAAGPIVAVPAAGAAPAGAPAPAPVTSRPAPPSAGPGIVFPDGADEVVVPATQMRRGIAAQMTRALQVPHAHVHVEVNATNLVALRDSLKRDYRAREGLSLGFVPFVVKAAVEALKRHPTFNAHWTEQGLVARRRINVGVAVAVDDGLIVPVIRDVDRLSISGINRAIADVAGRARAGKLRVDDFGGGTFTVDNTGWFGSILTLPIINVPEVAILTMEAITKRAVVLETADGDVIAIRPVMNMVVGIDHRANDGAQAGYFLRDVKAWLEAVGPETAVH